MGNAEDLRLIETPAAKEACRKARAEHAAEQTDAARFEAAKTKAARGDPVSADELAALSPAQGEEIISLIENSMIFAIIEFPNGARISLGVDGRWTGDALFAGHANAIVLSLNYRPNWARNVADEIAAATGGKVIEAVDDDSEIPDDATP